MVHDGKGAVICLDAKTGEDVYQERLAPRPRKTYASAILADGKLYIVSQHRGTFVLAAQPEYKLLAHNTVEDDSRFNASPCISNGQVFLRSDRYLYCIGD
jgi:outer membrane protein assembly factor BamB